jgi:hypothetical protein
MKIEIEVLGTNRYWVKGFTEKMENGSATYEEQTLQNLLDRYADGRIEL